MLEFEAASEMDPELVDALHVFPPDAVTLLMTTDDNPAGTLIVAEPRFMLLALPLLQLVASQFVIVNVYGALMCPAVSVVGAMAAL